MACSSQKKKTLSTEKAPSTESQIEAFAKKRFNSDYLLSYNKPKDYVMIYKLFKIKPSDPMPTIQYEILELKTMESIFSDAVPKGEVEWEEDYILKATSKAGIPGPDGQTGKSTYRYHVKNRKKYSGGFMNKDN